MLRTASNGVKRRQLPRPVQKVVSNGVQWGKMASTDALPRIRSLVKLKGVNLLGDLVSRYDPRMKAEKYSRKSYVQVRVFSIVYKECNNMTYIALGKKRWGRGRLPLISMNLGQLAVARLEFITVRGNPGDLYEAEQTGNNQQNK